MKRPLLALLLIALAGHAMGADCSRREAMRATVPQIAQYPDEYMGRCVRIDGVMFGHSLFANVDGVYVQSPDALDDTKSGQRIGIDGGPREFRRGYRHVSVLGRVQDCETVRRRVQASAGPGEVVMTAGYCHTAYGPYVHVDGLQYHSGAPFLRQTGGYERANYGDIEPVPPTWLHRPMIETQAAKFLAALRTGDRDTLADMHFRNVGEGHDDAEAQMLRFLLDDPRSPFGALRKSSTAPQTMILSYRNLEDTDEYSAFVCFCRENDCSGRWPLASFDADNLSGRPYACTTIQPYVYEGHDVPHFETPARKTGLAEPTHYAR